MADQPDCHEHVSGSAQHERRCDKGNHYGRIHDNQEFEDSWFVDAEDGRRQRHFDSERAVRLTEAEVTVHPFTEQCERGDTVLGLKGIGAGVLARLLLRRSIAHVSKELHA